jgi:hypothetical protein
LQIRRRISTPRTACYCAAGPCGSAKRAMPRHNWPRTCASVTRVLPGVPDIARVRCRQAPYLTRTITVPGVTGNSVMIFQHFHAEIPFPAATASPTAPGGRGPCRTAARQLPEQPT